MDTAASFSRFRDWPLQIKLALYGGFIVVLGIGALAWYVVAELERNFEHLVAAEQATTASFVARTIDRELTLRSDALRNIAGPAALLLDSPARLQDFLNDRPTLHKIFNRDVYVISRAGVRVAEAPMRGLAGGTYTDRDYFNEVLKTGRPVFKPIMGRFARQPVLITALPLLGIDGAVLGVLCGAELIAPGNPFNFAGEVRYGSTGGFHIISPKDGVYVASSDPARVLRPTPRTGVNPLYDRRLQGFLGMGRVVDSRGLDILSTAARTTVQDWLVIAYLPAREAFAPLTGISSRIYTGAVTVSLLVGLSIWLILRRELAPLESAARALAETGPVEIVPPLEEKGSREVRLLLANFNRMRLRVLEQNDSLNGLLRDREAILSSDIVAFVKVKGRRYVWVNQAFCAMFGYDMEEIIGESSRLLYASEEDSIRFAEAAYPVIAGGGVFRCEVRYRRKDGSLRWYQVSGEALYAGGDESVWATVDIDDRKLAEEELHRLNSELEHRVAERTAQLEHSNRELDDFAYIASHDLKEPLRGLHNYASFLAEDYADRLDDEGRHYLERMQRLVERLTSLIDRLLAYSRLGSTALPMEPVILDAVLDEVAEDLKPFLAERGVELVRETPLPTVVGNGTRLGEVFQNLITNGAKYNDKQTKEVRIGCEPTPAPVFYVRDNGIGIAPQHRESVFRIFKRLHEQDKFGGGTGAGLTIVKKIVERHGGRIWLESTPGEGTTFYFTLSEEP